MPKTPEPHISEIAGKISRRIWEELANATTESFVNKRGFQGVDIPISHDEVIRIIKNVLSKQLTDAAKKYPGLSLKDMSKAIDMAFKKLKLSSEKPDQKWLRNALGDIDELKNELKTIPQTEPKLPTSQAPDTSPKLTQTSATFFSSNPNVNKKKTMMEGLKKTFEKTKSAIAKPFKK